MSTNWLKPNLYIVQNGKLVPRPTTPEQKKNYRYIPYDPMNNPTPDDYFRETISRLQKENTTLRNQLAQKLEDVSTRNLLHNSGSESEEIRQYQLEIASLRQELGRREQELQQKNQQLTHKDKQILEIGNENTRLHLRINSVVKQIESLNKLMNKKDQQLLSKKQQIQQYCRTLEKLTTKQKQEQKTMFSENYLMTPRIEEKGEQEDEYYSVQYNSDRNSLDRRYMTPEIQSFRVDDHRQHLHRSQEQKPVEAHNFKNVKNNVVYVQEDNRSNASNRASSNVNHLGSWAAQANKGNIISLDLVKGQMDPVVGGFSSYVPAKR